MNFLVSARFYVLWHALRNRGHKVRKLRLAQSSASKLQRPTPAPSYNGVSFHHGIACTTWWGREDVERGAQHCQNTDSADEEALSESTQSPNATIHWLLLLHRKRTNLWTRWRVRVRCWQNCALPHCRLSNIMNYVGDVEYLRRSGPNWTV